MPQVVETKQAAAHVTNNKVFKAPEPRDVKLTRKPTKDLRFSPYAWAKLMWLRDRGDTEISAFGISSLDDLLYVKDVKLVKQTATGASFEFDDDALNDYLTDMVEAGHQPCECMRIWVHTHPHSSTASATDIETFNRTTEHADWGIMCIIGSASDTYVKLRMRSISSKLACDFVLKAMVDYTGEFAGVNDEAAKQWEAEYLACVQIVSYTPMERTGYDWHKWYKQSYAAPGFDYADYSKRDKDDDITSYIRDHVVDNSNSVPDLNTYLGNERVQFINDEKDSDGEETTVVWTDNYWFSMPSGARLKVKEGAVISRLEDIAEEPPVLWGECLIEETSGQLEFSKSTIYTPTDGAFAEFDQTEDSISEEQLLGP